MTDPMPYPDQDAHELLCRSLDEAEAKLLRAAFAMADAAREAGKALYNRQCSGPESAALSGEYRAQRREYADLLRETFRAIKSDAEAAGVPSITEVRP